MKILIIHQPGTAGVARHVLDLVSGLSKSNIDVWVIYSKDETGSYYRQSMDSLKQRGVKFKDIPMRRSIGFYDFISYLKIMRFILENGPFDIVHSHASKAGALTRLIPLKLNLVYSPHAYVTMNKSLSRFASLFYTHLEKLLSMRGVTVVTSIKEGKEAVRIGLNHNKTHLIYHGSESLCCDSENITNRDLYRQKWGVDSDTIILGSVARYDFQKDHAFAVKFMFWLHSTYNFKVKLVFVGDGEEKVAIENLINKLDIKDKVIMESPANFKDVMPAFDFYFMHSHYEGFPYVLVDAMFFGLPLLCRNVGGAEIVHDGINGVYLDDFSPERSALKFLKCIRTPQNITDFSNASRQSSSSFRLKDMIENYINFYNSIKNR